MGDGTPLLGESSSLNKHDADCLRRKAETGAIYLCTCDLTDAEVAKAHKQNEDKG